MELWWPSSAREVREHFPTESEWNAELASGWRGSDGSSNSLDDIEGVKVGETGTRYMPDLPAPHHDYDYRTIRRLVALHVIDEKMRAEMQQAADEKHLEGLQRKVSVLVGFSGWKARARARVRYAALRLLGRSSTMPRRDEMYRTGGIPGGGRAPSMDRSVA